MMGPVASMVGSERSGEIRFVDVDPASGRAHEALAHYYAELDARFDDGFDAAAPNAGTDDESMRTPLGGFVVLDDEGDTVGCGAVQRFDDRTAEIKRMWLDSSLRGRGYGKRLLAHLEHVAADLGYDVIVLDTNATLTEAISMYASAGYEQIERYNDNPYAQRWFRKELGDGRAGQ